MFCSSLRFKDVFVLRSPSGTCSLFSCCCNKPTKWCGPATNQRLTVAPPTMLVQEQSRPHGSSTFFIFKCIIMHVPEYTLALWMIGSVCRACMTSLFVHSLIARHAGVCTKITRGVHRVYSPLSHRVQLTNCLPVSSGMKLPPLSLHSMWLLSSHHTSAQVTGL